MARIRSGGEEILDTFDALTRSRIMSRSRSRGSGSTERRFRSLLVRSGIRGWKLGHASGLTGSPDVIFTRGRIAIFLDGCFWHGCRRCRSIPSTHRTFWMNKIENNRKRDRKVLRALRAKGWKVLRIWEHELRKDSYGVLRKVQHATRITGTPWY
jgi:DNA mismatch endonuclease (patch repair protein)